MRLHGCVALLGSSLVGACCDNSIAVRTRSPFEPMEARAVVGNCGATTGFTTSLVFAYPEANPTKGAVFAVFNGVLPVTFQWEGKDALRVTFPGCVASQTMKAQRVHNRMRIEYAQVPPDSRTCAPLPMIE
jgi:hypothetical protein